MGRLPTPGGDDGTWGQVLNDFLNVEHNNDGSLKRATDATSQLYIFPGQIDTSNQQLISGGIPASALDSISQAKLNTPPSTEPGDGTITDVKVAPGAAIEQTKVANLGSS